MLAPIVFVFGGQFVKKVYLNFNKAQKWHKGINYHCFIKIIDMKSKL